MKNLELESFGLVEMEKEEQGEMNGGVVWGIIIPFAVALWCGDSLLNYKSTVAHFKKGWDSVE